MLFRSTNAATCPSRVNEESADPSRVVNGVECRILSGSRAIAAENGATPTPAAAADNMAGVFDDEVSAVADELAVHAEDRAQRGLDLRGRIGGRLQNTCGKRDENLQSLDVILSRKTY